MAGDHAAAGRHAADWLVRVTIIDYVLAQIDARERMKDPAWWPKRDVAARRPPRKRRISIAGDLGGEPVRRVYPQRDGRRKWVRAA